VTIQVRPTFTSKDRLREAIEEDPEKEIFVDPAIIGGRGRFAPTHMAQGEAIEVVLDHPQRRRFAKITRLGATKWRIE
jgi:hypothetical protein